MMTNMKPKRRNSLRLKGYDYAQPGAYFVTVVTHQWACLFGEIVDNKMLLTHTGKIVEWEWEHLAKQFDFVELGAYQVMPNHFHAIIGIGENEYNSGGNAMHGRGAMHRASTEKIENNFGPQSKNLASIIRGFKSSVTKYARINKIDFLWQPRFHDHIIRNEKSYQRISDYIPKTLQIGMSINLEKTLNSKPIKI